MSGDFLSRLDILGFLPLTLWSDAKSLILILTAEFETGTFGIGTCVAGTHICTIKNRKSPSYPLKQTYSFDEVFRRRERRCMEREP